jgi:hypothetical protein
MIGFPYHSMNAASGAFWDLTFGFDEVTTKVRQNRFLWLGMRDFRAFSARLY